MIVVRSRGYCFFSESSTKVGGWVVGGIDRLRWRVCVLWFLRNILCRLWGVPPKDIDRGALRAPGHQQTSSAFVLKIRSKEAEGVFSR